MSSPQAPRCETNLQTDRTSFVGREDELAAISALFAEGARVVTLLGPGGVGKTRLARRHAAGVAAAEAPAGGVWFCDLAEARSGHDVLAAVSAALGVPLAPGATADLAALQLGHALAAREDALVILDNFEQVIPHAQTTVGSWPEMAPSVRLLVTSRIPLRLADESCHEVSPLREPDAARLFEERARLVQPDFVLDAADREIVHELARRLDGAPLAIELAAARAAVLPPRALLERLASRLDLLRSSRQSSPRHATLRAAIAWSWDLLRPEEREALAQSAVFHGGFSLEAAEAVWSFASPEASAVDVLAALVDQSLVRRLVAPGSPGEARFSLYESVREFAAEQLDAETRVSALRRHAEHYVDRGEAWSQERLSLERDNLAAAVRRGDDPDCAARAALCLDPLLAARGPAEAHLEILDAAIQAGPADARLRIRLATARGAAERMRGRLAESRAELERAAEAAAREAPELEGPALCALADLQLDAGQPAEARTAAERALALATRARDERTEAIALYTLGRANLDCGDLREAEARCEQALVGIGKLGYRRLDCRVHNLLGIVCLRRGEMADAEAQLGRALAVAREISDRQQESTVLGNLAKALADRVQHDQAAACFDEALGLARRMGYRRSEGVLLTNRAMLEHDRGRLAEARAAHIEGLAIHREVGNRRFEAIALEFRGVLELEQGRNDEARVLLSGALLAARESGLAAVEGFVLAHLAALESILGAIAEAQALFSAARAVHASVGGPEMVAAIDLLEALLDLARADRASAEARHAASAPAGERWSLVRVDRRLVARALGAAPPPGPAAPGLELGPEGRWFTVAGGDRVDLSRRRALRLILLHLVDRGEASSLDELVEAGWPDERIVREAGLRRVYTAIGMLRDLGLRGVLVRRDDGYLIDPAVEVRIHRAPE